VPDYVLKKAQARRAGADRPAFDRSLACCRGSREGRMQDAMAWLHTSPETRRSASGLESAEARPAGAPSRTTTTERRNMSLQCGIVGLPNVGKSTLFNALTKAGIAAENYPFCTIEPNVGVVEVPDRASPSWPRSTSRSR
jgi:hypothetical protein